MAGHDFHERTDGSVSCNCGVISQRFGTLALARAWMVQHLRTGTTSGGVTTEPVPDMAVRAALGKFYDDGSSFAPTDTTRWETGEFEAMRAAIAAALPLLTPIAAVNQTDARTYTGEFPPEAGPFTVDELVAALVKSVKRVRMKYGAAVDRLAHELGIHADNVLAFIDAEVDLTINESET